MPRMSRKRKNELAFFLNDRGRVAYNVLCRKCRRMLNRKLSVEKRKERNHRIFLFGGFMESIVPELKTMTEDEGKDFLYHIAKSMEAQEYAHGGAVHRAELQYD